MPLPVTASTVTDFQHDGLRVTLFSMTIGEGGSGLEVRFEDTGAGDGLRFYGSQKNGMSGWFANANWGKRSIALDIKTDAGSDEM